MQYLHLKENAVKCKKNYKDGTAEFYIK